MQYDLFNKIGRSKKGCEVEADLNTSLARHCDKI